MYIYKDHIRGRRFETESLVELYEYRVELYEYVVDNYPQFHSTISENLKPDYMRELEDAKYKLEKAIEYEALSWYKKLSSDFRFS